MKQKKKKEKKGQKVSEEIIAENFQILENEIILRELEQYSHYSGTRRRRERERDRKCLEEVVAKNFPNLGQGIVSQAMEIHRSPNTRDPRKTTPRCIVVKIEKINDKDRLLKAARERNKITYNEAEGPGNKITLSGKLSFKYDGRIK